MTDNELQEAEEALGEAKLLLEKAAEGDVNEDTAEIIEGIGGVAEEMEELVGEMKFFYTIDDFDPDDLELAE